MKMYRIIEKSFEILKILNHLSVFKFLLSFQINFIRIYNIHDCNKQNKYPYIYIYKYINLYK